ncbi:hypothetical protein LINGRAHAP2_LOCUS33635 [Linum grandiflorum]
MVSGVRMLLDKVKGFTLFPGFRRHPWNKRLATRHLSSPDKVMDYLHKCGVHVKTVTMVKPKETGTGYSEDCIRTLQIYGKVEFAITRSRIPVIFSRSIVELLSRSKLR